MEDFKFSENLRDKVEEAMVDRLTDALQQGNDVCESIIRSGYSGIDDMPCHELMDEYMNWHGAYSLKECPDDQILRKMIEEWDSYLFEKEVLTKEEA
jgi:hypothetical protein